MDLTSPRTIKEISNKYDFGFSKGLGQNFLLDKNVLEKIVEAAEIEAGVLEIGPGFGVLTYELAQNSPKVVSIEIDRRLIPILEYTLGEFDNVKIVENDVLKTDLHELIKNEFPDSKISVAANLPYYITTPIIARLLEEKLPIENIVVMVQKEVAERICSLPGKKDYGAISVMCQYYTIPEIVTIVPAGSFMPPPKVDSAVLKLKIRKEPPCELQDEKLFFKVVKSAFAQRRKTLENGLSNGLSIEKKVISSVFEACSIPAGIRGEKLSIEEFAAISNELSKLGYK